MIESLEIKDHNREYRTFIARIIVGACLVVALTGILVARLVQLQVAQHDVYSTLSNNNRIQVLPMPPVRGLIHDRNGVLLAENVPSFDVAVVSERVPDLEATIAQLRGMIDISDRELEGFRNRLKRRTRPYEAVPVKFKLSQEEIARVSVDLHALQGVQIEATLVRHYPLDSLTAHAVGSVRRISEEDDRKLDRVAYAGTNFVGKVGIEQFYESDLHGTVGYRQVETDARGTIMKVLSQDSPKQGSDIKLHLDTSLQRAAHRALDGRRGTIVAIEPATGGILALVSEPSYDPNLFVTGMDHRTYAALRDSIDIPLFNRATQGQYEPGSTIKPLIGLAGLVSGTVALDDAIEDKGVFRLPGSSRMYRDWNWTAHNPGGHGSVDFTRAIYRSCNVYFYDLAYRLGVSEIDRHLRRFGFGERTALDIPAAKPGLLPTPEWKMGRRGQEWQPGDTVNIGIGQGDMLVTPLQLATAVAMIANRGKWVAPRLMMSGSDLVDLSTAHRVYDVDDVPDEYWDAVIESMEKVVHRGNQGYGENGTAWAYIGQNIPYRMAGKSGTAQVVGIKQGEVYDAETLDERLRKHAWFVAFAPVSEPRIAVAVLVENGGGGSEVAAPVARQVIDHHLLEGDASLLAVGSAR